MASPKRAAILTAAVQLFLEHGFHATGVDRIAEAADVSKRTLYKHFHSKDELVLAALRDHDSAFRNAFIRSVESRAADPAGRILAVFDAAHDWFGQDDFHGCLFVHAAGEYQEPDTAIRAACTEYKRLMRGYVRDNAKRAGAADPDQLANEVALLLDGAIVTAHVSSDTAAATRAQRIAKLLLAEQGVATPS